MSIMIEVQGESNATDIEKLAKAKAMKPKANLVRVDILGGYVMATCPEKYIKNCRTTKICKGCEKDLPLSEYHLCGGQHQTYCKKCMNAITQKNKAKLRKRQVKI